MVLFIQLLLAHILTDFVLQPNAWIAHKRKHRAKSVYLLLHAAIAGVLTYVFVGEWQWWYVALFIAGSHFFIDLWKLSTHKDNLAYFLWDQLFHLLAICVAWLYMTRNFEAIGSFFVEIIHSPGILAVLTGYLVIIFPAGFIIGKATERWQDDLENSTGLKAAGRYIGIFERILVLTFMLTGNFSAIGFLIAAKSILRFNDKTETGARKQTEYVLIGTLMSFAITILIGFLIRVCFF